MARRMRRRTAAHLFLEGSPASRSSKQLQWTTKINGHSSSHVSITGRCCFLLVHQKDHIADSPMRQDPPATLVFVHRRVVAQQLAALTVPAGTKYNAFYFSNPVAEWQCSLIASGVCLELYGYILHLLLFIRVSLTC
ncbi:uncharacterized protein [Triticum aestivum]|uniref:uncharacterized protein n=1 Tax=Triticum aestivum TaxID=4565 RepID=UPI001D00C16A|nr:uncharacterized protein LOC123123653 [Triticum aestivum]